MMAWAWRSWWPRCGDDRSKSAIRSAFGSRAGWPASPFVRRQGHLRRGVAHSVRWDEYKPSWRQQRPDLAGLGAAVGPLQNGPFVRCGERPTPGLRQDFGIGPDGARGGRRGLRLPSPYGHWTGLLRPTPQNGCLGIVSLSDFRNTSG